MTASIEEMTNCLQRLFVLNLLSVFLRVLEYFNGLLFLTTNRVSGIDEAIVSRCIAMIKYHPPIDDDRNRIWQVMIDQFSLNVESNTIQIRHW